MAYLFFYKEKKEELFFLKKREKRRDKAVVSEQFITKFRKKFYRPYANLKEGERREK